MAPVKQGRFEFRPETIVSLRKQLQRNQSQMATMLGVSVNTLSRWETGKTIPDANALAALYSLGASQGAPPSFFHRRRAQLKQPRGRSRLLVFWDFQGVARSADQVVEHELRIRTALQSRFPGASESMFKAFASPAQHAATDVLVEHGWRVFEEDEDIDADLVAQARSDCGQQPSDTILVLIAADRGYAELVSHLKTRNVCVYLLRIGQPDSARLKQAIGSQHCLTLA